MMRHFYDLVRPVVARGDVQNWETVSTNAHFVEDAIALEERKHSSTRIMGHFYKTLDELLEIAATRKPIGRVMDVGSATGRVIARVASKRPDIQFLSVDIMDEAIRSAREKFKNLTNVRFQTLDFITDKPEVTPDLMMCLQTLEHIEDKALVRFIERLFEVAGQAVLVSVPREPFWCMANLARLHYLTRLGNPPHHVQHWRRTVFEKLVTDTARRVWGDGIEVIGRSPLHLWTMLLIIRK